MQQIVALARCLGYDVEGDMRAATFPPRKPLIRKKQVIWRTRDASAHRIAQHQVGSVCPSAWRKEVRNEEHFP